MPSQKTSLDTLTALETPALVLDMDKAERNVARLTKHLTRLGVTFRTHVKTAKSIDVVRRLFRDQRGPITVSTIKEAEYFAYGGFTDITYAVGLAPDKIAGPMSPRGAAMRLSG
jgi:D-serine deaminase-like pyridoxal phosphate-dependent protein